MSAEELISAFEAVGVRSVFHITHIDNLRDIGMLGLLPKRAVDLQQVRYRDISLASAQQRRDVVRVSASSDGGTASSVELGLHDMVPLYFNPRNAMLYRRVAEHVPMCVIEIPIGRLIDGHRVIAFSNGNMAAAGSRSSCNRSDLSRIRWADVRRKSWVVFDPEETRQLRSRTCSELLVAPSIPAEAIGRVLLAGPRSHARATRLLAGTGLSMELRIADPELFFGQGFPTALDDAVLLLDEISTRASQGSVATVEVEASSVVEERSPSVGLTATPGRPAGSNVTTPQGTFDEDGNYTPHGYVGADAGAAADLSNGQLVRGVVVMLSEDGVLLDIGWRAEGFIPAREMSIRNEVDPREVVSLGESVDAVVLRKEDRDGRLILSRRRAEYDQVWGTIVRIKESDGTVEGPVIEVVKGGLIVDVEGVRGFLPASLVELRRVSDLDAYLGKHIEARVIEIDRARNGVVLSRRAALEAAPKAIASLKPGEVREGVVSSVLSFGAFVDLGGMDGLIHVSELSWKHVDHPGAVVTVGDKVTVQVLDVDFDRERISLSLRATQQDPWQEFASTHEVGQLVYGRVTNLVPFGSFVELGDGIEGLVHISEMSTHHVDAPEQVVTPGEELWVKIIDLDFVRRRISLSIKRAAEGGELAEEYRQLFERDEHGNWRELG